MTRSYTVTGPHPVLGFAPGETFRADLEEGLEARLLARGQIEKDGERADTSVFGQEPEENRLGPDPEPSVTADEFGSDTDEEE